MILRFKNDALGGWSWFDSRASSRFVQFSAWFASMSPKTDDSDFAGSPAVPVLGIVTDGDPSQFSAVATEDDAVQMLRELLYRATYDGSADMTDVIAWSRDLVELGWPPIVLEKEAEVALDGMDREILERQPAARLIFEIAEGVYDVTPDLMRAAKRTIAIARRTA